MRDAPEKRPQLKSLRTLLLTAACLPLGLSALAMIDLSPGPGLFDPGRTVETVIQLPPSPRARITVHPSSAGYEILLEGQTCDSTSLPGDRFGLILGIDLGPSGETNCLVEIRLDPSSSTGADPALEQSEWATTLKFRGYRSNRTEGAGPVEDAINLAEETATLDFLSGDLTRTNDNRHATLRIEEHDDGSSVVIDGLETKGEVPGFTVEKLSSTRGTRITLEGIAIDSEPMLLGLPPVELVSVSEPSGGEGPTRIQVETSYEVEPTISRTETGLSLFFETRKAPASRTPVTKPARRSGSPKQPPRASRGPSSAAPTQSAPSQRGSERHVSYGDPVVVTAAVLRSTIITLNPDEEVRGASLADSERWDVGWGSYGPDQQLTPTIAITPRECDITTNLQVMTTKRLYSLILDSPACSSQRASSNPDLPFDSVVRYRYSSEQLIQNMPVRGSGSQSAPEGPFSDGDLDGLLASASSYRVAAKRRYRGPRPVLVTDDGKSTFIVFQKGAWRGRDLPLFFLETQDGNREIANFDVERDTFAIRELFRKAVLIGGTSEKRPDRQPRLEITRIGEPQALSTRRSSSEH